MRKINFLVALFLLFFIYPAVQGQSGFVDDFSDGDFTTNPAWSGNVSNFQISGSNQLQLNDIGAGSSNTSFLVTNSTTIQQSNWEFYVNLDFNPSTANYAKVYLTSDNSNLNTNLNGYYVRIGGQSGTVDNVRLYRQDGSSDTLLINGTSGTVATSPEVKIRVTKNTHNEWELFLDQSATGGSYVSQGSAIENKYTTSAFFGVYCRYSSTRFDKFLFDDFVVSNSPIQDTVPPTLTGISVRSGDTLQLNFNEKLESFSALSASNFQVNNGVGSPNNVVFTSQDSTAVYLLFSTPFINGTTYEITTQNIADLSGNTMLTDRSSFTYFVPENAVYRDLVINELYPDFSPSNGLPEGEYIELFNVSSKVFDLANWTLSDGTSTAILSSQIIRPGEFIILCSQSKAPDFSPFGLTQGQATFPTLNNTGDNISLTDNNGLLIDFVNYTDDWYQDENKNKGGFSLEQINPFSNCTGQSNFIASTAQNGGTPGVQNTRFDTLPDASAPSFTKATLLSADSLLLEFDESLDSISILNATYSFSPNLSINGIINQAPEYQSILLTLSTPLDSGFIYTLSINGVTDCSGNMLLNGDSISLVLPGVALYRDVVINELLPDVSPSNGLPETEFVELFNASSKVINLDGWSLSDGSSTANLSSQILNPGEFILLCPQDMMAAYFPFGLVQGLSSFPSLNDSGDELTLRNNNGVLIDFISYNKSWYQDEGKENGGYSLEQINPFTLCSGQNNFTASNQTMGGTPGGRNSVFDTLPDIDPPIFVRVAVLTADSLLLEFNEVLDSISTLNAIYSFSQPIVVDKIFNQPPNYQSVILTLSTPLDSGIIYQLSINGITDCSGNSLSNNDSVGLVLPNKASYRDVVINELFPDISPSNGLPEGEFIELFNASSKIVNLDGWSLSDRSNNTVVLSSQILQPGELIILCPQELTADYVPFGLTQGQQNFPSLGDSDDLIRLKDNNGRLMDLVNYDRSWFQDENKESGGYSLEQINPFASCSGQNNFTASNQTIGGTPGTQNSVFDTAPDTQEPRLLTVTPLSNTTIELTFNESMDSLSIIGGNYLFEPNLSINTILNHAPDYQKVTLLLNDSNALDSGVIYVLSVSNVSDCSGNQIEENTSQSIALPSRAYMGDLVINEILFNPYSGGSDFIELFNRSKKVIGLESLQIANADGEPKTITNTPVLLFPSDYVALTIDKNNVAETYMGSVKENIFEVASLPSFNDSDGEAILLNTLGDTIDQISYTDDQHFDLLKDDEGVSLERISPERPSDDLSNWHSASEKVNFATPGYLNSQDFSQIVFRGKVTLDPEIISPDNDGFQDILNINYQFDAPGYVANVSIFDHKGRLIKTLIRNELLDSRGTFSWDGTTDENTKARIGIYVVFFEAFTTSGEKEIFKEVVTVASQLK